MSIQRPLHAPILLTSPLEAFTVGHTIVLSRGLIDVLRDEASLATMLAHELSHVALGHELPDSLEQIAALQLGARLVVDAWSGKVVLDRSPAVPLMSVREKVPFAVTPLMPVIRYAEPPGVGTPPDVVPSPERGPVRTVGELQSN